MLKQIIINKLFPKNKFRSLPERSLYNFINENYNVKQIKVNDRKVLKGKELDLYLPEDNLAIEYNGLYWHSYPFLEKNEAKIKHNFKTKKCSSNDISLVHIWEDDWIYNRENVENILDIHLNKYSRKRVILNSKVKILKNKEESYSSFDRFSIQRFNKNLKDLIYSIQYKDNVLAYIQVVNKQIKNIAIYNKILSMVELISILKKNNRFRTISLDRSQGIQNFKEFKILKFITPKSRKIQNKKRKAYCNTSNNIIWDCGYNLCKF